MQTSKLVILGAAVALLAACGGGGGGPSSGGGGNGGGGGGDGGGDGPTSNDTLTNLTVSETFATAAATMTGTVEQGGTVSGVSSGQSGLGTPVTLAYDAANDSYTVKIDQAGISANTTFQPTDRDAGSSTATYDVFKSGDDQFVLFKPGNATKTLTYTTYGGWLRRTASGSNVDFDTSFFVFGVSTPAEDMPTTGTASYAAAVDGYWVNTSGLQVLQGDGALTADFAAGAMSGAFALNGVDEGGTSHGFDTFDGAASITGNLFSGTMTGRNTDYSGTWGGGFFGPGAEEVGGSFRLTDPADSGNQAVGVFVGNRP
jgi:hypothetical protein